MLGKVEEEYLPAGPTFLNGLGGSAIKSVSTSMGLGALRQYKKLVYIN